LLVDLQMPEIEGVEAVPPIRSLDLAHASPCSPRYDTGDEISAALKSKGRSLRAEGRLRWTSHPQTCRHHANLSGPRKLYCKEYSRQIPPAT
jgi:hypothetical protein